jgi:hypothetical protein
MRFDETLPARNGIPKTEYIYRILFTVDGDVVHILHIRHGRRMPLDEPH